MPRSSSVSGITPAIATSHFATSTPPHLHPQPNAAHPAVSATPSPTTDSDAPHTPGMMDIEMDDAVLPSPFPHPARSTSLSSGPSPWSSASALSQTDTAIPQCVPPSLLTYSLPSRATSTPAAAAASGGLLVGAGTPTAPTTTAAPKKKSALKKDVPVEEFAEGTVEINVSSGGGGEKRFRCPVEGCGKVYKQQNGLKCASNLRGCWLPLFAHRSLLTTPSAPLPLLPQTTCNGRSTRLTAASTGPSPPRALSSSPQPRSTQRLWLRRPAHQRPTPVPPGPAKTACQQPDALVLSTLPLPFWTAPLLVSRACRRVLSSRLPPFLSTAELALFVLSRARLARSSPFSPEADGKAIFRHPHLPLSPAFLQTRSLPVDNSSRIVFSVFRGLRVAGPPRSQPPLRRVLSRSHPPPVLRPPLIDFATSSTRAPRLASEEVESCQGSCRGSTLCPGGRFTGRAASASACCLTARRPPRPRRERRRPHRPSRGQPPSRQRARSGRLMSGSRTSAGRTSATGSGERRTHARPARHPG